MSNDQAVPTPKCLAMMLCEQVIQDAQTKNLTLVNTFNRITTKPGKTRYPRLAVFVSLTNGHGQGQGALTITAPSGEEIFRGEGQIVFPDPLAVVELTFDIRLLPLPEAGEYSIQFWCDGEPINQRKFSVDAADQKQE